MKRNLVRIGFGVILAAAIIGSLEWQRHQRQRDIRQTLRISCVNNLKQIGLSLRIWGGDHGELLPWCVSTNAGGSMEFCATNADGQDSNSFLHFGAMAQELSTPKVLVCPHDPNTQPATSFASLQSSNVSYRLHIVPGMTNLYSADSKAVLIVCPFDGNTLHYDGSVESKEPESPDGSQPMRLSGH